MRQLTQGEMQILLKMLEQNEEARKLIPFLSTAFVEEMNDGGMGSLKFVTGDSPSDGRQYGGIVAGGEFIDKDGTLVSLEIYVDKSGRLYEVDVWKVDSSPLIAWPNPVDLRPSSAPNRLE